MPVQVETQEHVPSPSVEQTPSTAATARWSGELQAAAVASGREVPNAGVGAGLSGAAVFESWLALELQLRAVAMVQPVAVDNVRHVSAQSYTATLLTCLRRRLFGRLGGEACVGPELYFIRAHGHGFEKNEESYVSGFGAHLAAGFKLDLVRGLALRLRAFTRLSPQPKRFHYTRLDGQREAFASRRVAAGATLGLSYAF